MVDIKGTNYVAMLKAKEDLVMEDIGIPSIEDDEVLLAMKSVGICGSDIKYWKYGVCGRFTLTSPMIMGHEGSGQVVKVGRKVTNLREGDRVAIEPGIPCRKCELCKIGRYNLCPDVEFCATPPVHGNIAQYYKHPADFCFKLPETVSYDEGALVEPLAVAVYSCERGGVGMDSTVLICGAGPVGLLTMFVARHMGASKIMLTDIDDNRLAVAKKYGADHILKVTTNDCRSLSSQIEQVMGSKPEISIECSGSDDSFKTSLYATKSGGCVVLVGRGSLEPKIPILEAATREVDIKGIFRYANCFPKAISFLASKTVDVGPLLNHHVPLMSTNQAFETAYDRNSGAIKVIIHCDQFN